MTVKQIQDEIIRLKKEKDICILAHAYQSREIIEIADFMGDSFALSVEASKVPQKTVIMCGVRFMAETVKILSPDKKVILSNPVAGCPMAEQMDRELILQVREQYPDYTVVAYINTTSELKTVCDVCVTSSSALTICKKLENDKILFIPDCNLGDWIAKQIPEKQFKLLNGGCPTHARISAKEVENVKKMHPDALLLVHPECKPEVVEKADYVGSTTGIMKFAEQSDNKEFIIFTGIKLLTAHMFYPLGKETVCDVVTDAGILPHRHDFTPSAAAIACLLKQFTLRRLQGCFPLFYHTGTQFVKHYIHRVPVLPYHDKLSLTRDSGDVDPLGVFQHIVLGVDAPVG